MNRFLTRQGWLVLMMVLAVAGLVVFIFFLIKKDEVAGPVAIEEVPVVEEPSLDGKYCFSRTQVATETEPYSVSEKITLIISNNIVTGTKTGTQAGLDMTNGYEGTLEGTKESDKLQLTYSYTIEGSQNKEKEIYLFSPEELKKERYVLKEEGGILVPDLTSEVKIINYTKDNCGQ
mgnify:FL=1